MESSSVNYSQLASAKKLNVTDFRNQLLVILVALLVLLNYGFMQLRFPMGIPVAEVGLVVALISIQHAKAFPRFLKISFALPIVLWWIVGIAHILWDLPQYGFWAIRDGGHVIESLFFYVGFTLVKNQKMLKKIVKLLPVFFIIILFYAMTYPFRETLQAISPKVQGTFHPVPLFFTYTNTAMILVAGAAYYLNTYLVDSAKRGLWLSGLFLTVALLLFPSRTILLQIMAFAIFFAFRFKGRRLKILLMAFAVPVVLLSFVSLSGISINGRFGEEFTPAQYFNIFIEIFPGLSQPEDSITSGTEGRFVWWVDILTKVCANPMTLFNGLGYGMPLLEHGLSDGSAIREPHNDLISILARGGLVMLTLFVWFQTMAIGYLVKLMKYYKNHPRYSSFIVGFLFIIIGTLISTLGEAPFIMAFYTVPYYFSLGLLCRFYLLRERYE